jgi:CheY-like chemotaxis protein
MKCRKILLVEDDYRLRQMIKNVLELSGIEVETTGNGREALDYLNQHPAPALMLLDLMMPVMSGPELLDKLNKDGRLNDFPIVLVSTVANDEELNSYGLPALMKPVNVQTLVDLGNQYCNAELVDKSSDKR